MFWLIALAQALVFGFASKYQAQEKGKDPTAWFWYGFLFGLIGFLAIALTPATRSTDESASSGGGTEVRSESPQLVFVETPPMALDLHSPVEVRDIGLAIDDRTGMVYARPAFFNVSDQVVTAVKFAITCYDSFGDPVGSTAESAIQDQSARPRTFLESKQSVPLFPAARKADLRITRVAFSDGTMWEKGNYELVTPFQPAIPQAARERLRRAAGHDAAGYGLQADTHWVCVCGRHELLAEPRCRRCHRSKDDVLTKFNGRAYVDTVLAEQEEQAAAETASIIEQQQLTKARRIKIAKFAAGIVAVIIVLALGVGQLSAYLTLRNGKALLAEGRFDDAVVAFKRLDGRFGAAQLIDDATYGKGMSLLDAGKYDAAAAAFKGLRNGSRLNDAVNEINYRTARSLFDAGDYVGAMKLFTPIAEYKDSRDYLAKWEEQQYQKALGLVRDGNPSKALDAFAPIAGYKDSQTHMNEVQYQDAQSFMRAGSYDTARRMLEKMPAFRDSAALAKEAMYQQALKLRSNRPVTTDDPDWNLDGDAFRSQYQSYELFRQLRGYKDVDAILRDSYFLHELADSKWASGDGAYSLEIDHITEWSPGAHIIRYQLWIDWHGPKSIRMWQLMTQIIHVSGNEFRDDTGGGSNSLTVVMLDPDTIRVSIDGATATLKRQAK